MESKEYYELGMQTYLKVRKEEMKALRSQGLTYQEIGKRYGISRERVRQILSKVSLE
jgi:DNA-directed RNA polymerase sigma subunit (sigma70/sigma32)